MGMKPDDFWNLTQYEFLLMARHYQKQQVRHRNDIIANAWYTAAFTRLKELKSIDKYMVSEEQNKPRQTDEDMMRVCRMFNAAMGGEVVERHG